MVQAMDQITNLLLALKQYKGEVKINVRFEEEKDRISAL